MAHGIPRAGEHPEKNTWRVVHYGEGDEARSKLLVMCPGCGVDSTMSRTVHTISPTGMVMPSYVCPHTDSNSCKYHEYVQLLEWGGVDDRTE